MKREIDGANVLALFKFADQAVQILDTSIDGLAICKYKEDPGYYLFYCDQWKVVSDLYFESIEDAKNAATSEFRLKDMNWTTAE